MNFINLTPHDIVLNSGKIYPATGNVARVDVTFSETTDPLFMTQSYGDVIDLPPAVRGTMYIVSAMVLAATTRTDVCSPASGHKDCRRNDKGQIVSVPCFVRH